MWEGIGQIREANPHASHASNAYQCADCHRETGDPINQCADCRRETEDPVNQRNRCHEFASPDGWIKPDANTVYGVTATESQY